MKKQQLNSLTCQYSIVLVSYLTRSKVNPSVWLLLKQVNFVLNSLAYVFINMSMHFSISSA